METGARHCTLLVGVGCGVWGWGVACEMVRLLGKHGGSSTHTQSPCDGASTRDTGPER